jgi:hypothetical protein
MHLLSRITMQIALLALCTASLPTANASCFASVGEVPIASSHLQFMPSAMLSDGMARDGEYQDDHGKRDDRPAPIVGLWNITAFQGQSVFLRGFDIFHSDHTEVLNEFHDPRTGNVCLGTWKRVGAHTYKVKHPAFLWDSNGVWIGYRIVRETIRVDPGGNTFHGALRVEVTDTKGTVLNYIDAVIVATRVTVDF